MAAPTRLHHVAHRHDPLQQRDRPRRRRHHRARRIADAQAEHQIVPRRIAIAPFRQLVAPRRAMFRPAQLLRCRRREDRRPRATGEDQFARTAAIVHRLVHPRHLQQPRLALDHHAPHVLHGRPDQSDPRIGRRAGDFADPLRPGAGLAKATARPDQPHAPVARRRHLPAVRPDRPAIFIIALLPAGQRAKQGFALILLKPPNAALHVRVALPAHATSRAFSIAASFLRIAALVSSSLARCGVGPPRRVRPVPVTAARCWLSRRNAASKSIGG